MKQQVLAAIDESDVKGKIVDPGVPDVASDLTGREAFTATGSSHTYEVRNVRIVTPLRAEDYPVLAAIWDNEEDDDIFADDRDL